MSWLPSRLLACRYVRNVVKTLQKIQQNHKTYKKNLTKTVYKKTEATRVNQRPFEP
jgi:hypothetical protein